MAFNKKLANKVLKYIETHPKEWKQDAFYRCETGMCYAGHTGILAGWKWKHKLSGSARSFSDNLMMKKRGKPDTCVKNVAEQELGLMGLRYGGHGLFTATNTLEDLREGIERLSTP